VYSITTRLGSEASRVIEPGQYRVLLVDDDESILEVLSTAFSLKGYTALEARDGSEALIRAERDAPDLVVLDLVMPRRSGFAVLDRLRQRHRSSPVIIVVTANTDPRHEQFAHDHGADAFFRKPFDVEELLETSATLLAAVH
jgi:DNA-binding response OmpR family regulator